MEHRKTILQNNNSCIGRRNSIIIIILSLLLFSSIAIANPTTKEMNWFIPGDLNGTSLWFNYSVADFGDEYPENICFGLKGGGICANLTTAQPQSVWNGTNINVGTVNASELCVGDSCISSWSEVNDSSGSTDISNKVNKTGDDMSGDLNISADLIANSVILKTGEYITASAFDDLNLYADDDMNFYPGGESVIDGDFRPATNMARNLGSLTTMWNWIYGTYLELYSDIIVGGNITADGNITTREYFIGNVCINNSCINSWSEVNSSSSESYNTSQQIWDNVINTSIIKEYNTSWITDNQAYWNNTDIDVNRIDAGFYNWTSGDDYIIFDGQQATFNESKLTVKYYNATIATAITGTINGYINQTQHTDGKYDDITLNITEQSGSPGLDLRMNFTGGIESFTTGVIRYYTSSLSGDSPVIQLWDYEDNVWENYPAITETETFTTIERSVFDSSEHTQNGIVQMRLYKSANGNTNNHYYIDWVTIAKGFGVPAPEEVDPFSVHRDGSTSLTDNWDTGGYTITTNTINSTQIYINGDEAINNQNISWITANQNSNTTTDIQAVIDTNKLGNTSSEVQSMQAYWNGTDINVLKANTSEMCIGNICISAWDEVNGSSGESYNTSQQIWDNVVNNGTFIYEGTKLGNISSEIASMIGNDSIIRVENTSWITDNQAYWNNTDISGSKLCVGSSCISSWSEVNSSVSSSYNTTQQIWDNVVNNNTFVYIGTKLGNTTAEIQAVIDTNKLGNTSAEIQANQAYWNNTNAYFTKLGIGTATPNSLLDVAGTINATEYCIGADCVTEWDTSVFRIHLKKSSATENLQTLNNLLSIHWDSEEYKHSNFTHSTTGDAANITIGSDGLYDIIFNVGVDNTGANRWSGTCHIIVNSVEVSSTNSKTYSRGSNYGRYQNMGGSTTISLSTSDKVEIKCESTDTEQATPVNTVTTDSEFIIKRVARTSVTDTWRPDSGWTDDGSSVRLTTSTDKVGIGIATPQKSLEINNGALYFSEGGDSGIVQQYSAGNNEINFVKRLSGVDSTNIMTIERDTGYVGIGTISPSHLFTVAGQSNFSSSIIAGDNILFNGVGATSGVAISIGNEKIWFQDEGGLWLGDVVDAQLYWDGTNNELDMIASKVKVTGDMNVTGTLWVDTDIRSSDGNVVIRVG